MKNISRKFQVHSSTTMWFVTSFSRQGQTKNVISWSTSYKTEFLSKELLLRFISSFHHVFLIRAFQKYYGLSRDFLLTSAFYVFLWKFKLYSVSWEQFPLWNIKKLVKKTFYLAFIWWKNNEKICLVKS